MQGSSEAGVQNTVVIGSYLAGAVTKTNHGGHGCSSSLGHNKYKTVMRPTRLSHHAQPWKQHREPQQQSVLALAAASNGDESADDGDGDGDAVGAAGPIVVYELGMHDLKKKLRTSSPSGRLHPDRQRREDLRIADAWGDVSFFASSRARLAKPDVAARGPFAMGKAAGPSGALDEFSARLPATQGWIGHQSWLESLRYYGPDEDTQEPELTGSFTGNTHGKEVPYHLEAGVRTRVGAARPDPEWMPEQLPKTWAPDFISPSMQKRLDRTLDRLLANRAQSAPHIRPGHQRTRPGSSLHADRLSVLSAPRGDPRQRMARHTSSQAAGDGKHGPPLSMTCSSVRPSDPFWRTTYALGSSPALSSGTPTTAASATSGKVSSSASSSAGATCGHVRAHT